MLSVKGRLFSVSLNELKETSLYERDWDAPSLCSKHGGWIGSQGMELKCTWIGVYLYFIYCTFLNNNCANIILPYV